MSEVIRLPGGVVIDLDALGPSEREVALDRLASWSRLVEGNPLLGWEPFGGQAEFLGCGRVGGRVSVKLAHAGNQAGKTEVGVVDDLIQCVDRDVLPGWLVGFKQWEPPFRCRVVTMDLEGTLFGVMLPKFQGLVPREQLVGGSWERAFDRSNRVLRFKNGSMVQFMSASQDREKHQGATLDRVHFDEEPPPPNGYGIYRESRMRVVARRGQIMFTMTPLAGAGMTWTYDEVFERRGELDTACFQWSMYDNPFLQREAVDAELASIKSDKERQARINGDFVAFRGRVLEEFDPDVHVVSPPSRGALKGLEVLVGYDPGIRRGGVVWCAFDRDNEMLVFDELYPEGLSVGQISEQMKAKNAFWGVRPSYVVIDPASRIRDMTNARETVMSELQRLGWYVVAGQNDRLAGILELKGRLEADRLKVSSACVNWLREADRWLVASDEETAEGRPKSSKGVSFSTLGPDHLMDPTRYVALERGYFRSPDEVKGPVRAQWVPGRAPDLSGVRLPSGDVPPLGSMS